MRRSTQTMLSVLVIAPLLSWAVNCTAQVPASDPNNTGGWTLNPAFSDEFDGSSLDTSKWANNGLGWSGRPPSYFSTSNVKVIGGNLQIILSKSSGGGQGQYAAGEVNTKANTSYGYYEARVKIGDSSGSAGFWMAADQGKYKTEIDILEASAKLNGGTGPGNMIFLSAHLWGAPGKPANGQDYASEPTVDWPPPWNPSADFHTYGLDWNASTITWYIDGVLARQIKNTDFVISMPIIFDVEVQTSWFGNPADSDLPSTIYVDYVRAWTKGDRGTNPSSTALPKPSGSPTPRPSASPTPKPTGNPTPTPAPTGTRLPVTAKLD